MRPGRISDVHIVQGGSAHPTQVLLLTEAEAAEYGTATTTVSGESGPRTHLGPRGGISHDIPRARAAPSNDAALPSSRRAG